MHSPSAKVVAAAVAALLIAAAVALADDGVPHDLAGWLGFAGKVISIAVGTGAAGYVKRETNPAPSAVETLVAQGRVRR